MFVLQQGFLGKDLQREALVKLGKRLAACIEELTRMLEKLDSLPLGDSVQEVKATRKLLVSKIQVLLALYVFVSHEFE